MTDVIIVIALYGAIGVFMLTIAAADCDLELPRGLRWYRPFARGVLKATRYALLRVFYPERVKRSEEDRSMVDPIARLELWHMAYELGHYPEECDRIANIPFLYDDTRRRYKAQQERESA
jgi:hypothetical protein